MKFTIQEQVTLEVPSASGLARHKGNYFVLGDDSPFLFKLSSDFAILEKILLLDNETREIIPKPEKADFEALEMISEKVMLGFGSGSLSPQRDRMLWIEIGGKNKIQSYSLTGFYSVLKQLDIMQGSELNIEAAAFQDDSLFLFNRGKNVIFSLPFSEFISAVKTGTPFPAVKASEFELPQINGISAGFSGATISASGRLVVTSTVENTPNAYDDGEVLGSFVGISSGVKNGIFEPLFWTPLHSEIPLKVESVVVDREINNELELVMITDSDGADSLILRGNLTL